MNYSEIFSKSWKIIWKYKILWIFGILAGCAEGSGGSGGGGGGGANNTYNGGNSFDPNSVWGQFEQFAQRAADFIENIPVWVWVLIGLAFMALIVVSVVLGLIGRIGLIHGAAKGDNEPARLSFGELLRESMPYFWRMFLLDLLYFGAGLAISLIVILSIVLLTVVTLGMIWLILLPVLCLLIPLSMVIDFFIKQSYVALINDNLGVFDAVKQAWKVFQKNLGHLIVVGLIIALGGLVIGLIIGLPMLIVFAPIIFGLINGTASGLQTALITAGVLFAIYLPVSILLSGVLRSYIYTAWTLTYRRLTAIPPAVVEVIPSPIEPEPVESGAAE